MLANWRARVLGSFLRRFRLEIYTPTHKREHGYHVLLREATRPWLGSM